MIHLNIEGSAQEIREEVKGLFGAPPLFGAPTPQPTEVEPPAKQTKKETKKETPSTQTETKAVETKETETQVVTKAAPPTGDVFAQIQVIIPKLVKAITRAKTVELLAKYKATDAKSIPEEERAAFLKEAQALLPA